MITTNTYTKNQIETIFTRYKHLISDGERLNSKSFADKIKEVYSLNNPIINKDWNIVRHSTELYWENTKVIKI